MRILYPHLRDEERTRAYNPYVKSFMYTQHSVGLCNYAVRRSASLYQLVTQVQRSPSFSRLEQAVLWTVCYTSSIICYRLQYDILLFGDRCTRVKNSPKVVTQSATRHLHSLPLLPPLHHPMRWWRWRWWYLCWNDVISKQQEAASKDCITCWLLR